MSRTLSHIPWWKRMRWYGMEYRQMILRGMHKGFGYEWYSGRPKCEVKAAGGFQKPGRWTKTRTHRMERRWGKRLVMEEGEK